MDKYQQLAEHVAHEHYLGSPISLIHRGRDSYDVQGVNCYDSIIRIAIRIHNERMGYINWSKGGQLGGRIFAAFRPTKEAA